MADIQGRQSEAVFERRSGDHQVRGGKTSVTRSRATAEVAGTPGWTELDTPVAPSPRNAHALTFDSKRQVLVLVGGIDRARAAQRLDVWEFGADGWREGMPPG